jgi:hypothetical protein
MAANGEVTQERGKERMQDFIFARELAEVYLLLDHLSGRSDKSLASAIGDGEDNAGKEWIQKICEVGWPPKGTVVEQGAQAATLLLAKDRLNAAAKPANGASIAFTLMVAGDDEPPVAQAHRRRGVPHWLRRLAFWTSAESPPKPEPVKEGDDAVSKPPASGSGGGSSAPPPVDAASNSAPTMPQGGGGAGNGGGNSDSPPGGIWGAQPPSRISLARLAYPGLVGSAGRFKWQVKAIIFLLFVWLIVTCALSWHITAGHAILARFDAIEAARTAIQKRIADAELDEVKQRSTPAPGSAPTPAAAGPSPTPAAAVAPKPLVQRYCERASRLPPPKDAPAGVKIDQFEDATQRQICDQLAENRVNYSNSREDIADWLAPWGLLKWSAHKLCGEGRCLKDETVALPANAVNQQQWASVLVELLATAVLPLCYGFLGAGAAVVRNIWGKMRDSLLSPRDLTLSLGQLALGAVIGACIGLFITPTGVGSQGAGGLTGSVTLTPSALSFIAGFGVESVFVALESLINRVFNTSNQKP